MRLIHYAKQHLTSVESRSQGEGRAARRCDKPNGLWVSVEGEDDWPSWCRGEEWGVDRLTHPTEIVLAPAARMLVIDTASGLRLFHRTYRHLPPIYENMAAHLRSYAINWPTVAQEYQGIVIAPYQWSMRLDDEAGWYYGWDCASGCIWNADAVAELKPLPVVEQAAAA